MSPSRARTWTATPVPARRSATSTPGLANGDATQDRLIEKGGQDRLLERDAAALRTEPLWQPIWLQRRSDEATVRMPRPDNEVRPIRPRTTDSARCGSRTPVLVLAGDKGTC
jgi:hypothetical protein